RARADRELRDDAGRRGERDLPRPPAGALLRGRADRAGPARGLRGSQARIRATSRAMAAAKSLVAAALLALAALAAVPSAVAGGPTLKLSSADQAKAAAAVLRRSDFPIGWRGGRVRPSKLK